MPRQRIIWSIAAIAAAATVTTVLLVRQGGRTPELPKGWSTRSVWMAGRHSVWSFRPEGAWVYCWLDGRRGADFCKFGDYGGHVFFEHAYDACDGKPPLKNGNLRLQTQGSIWILRLQDGTLLFQTPCPLRHGAGATVRSP